MTAYNRQIATATRLIKAKGAKCIWRKPVDPTPDADKPWQVTTNEPVEKQVSIVFARDGNTIFTAMIKGMDVPAGAELGYMHAVDFEPSVRDVIVRQSDGAELKVSKLYALQPDGVPIIYIVSFVL